MNRVIRTGAVSGILILFSAGHFTQAQQTTKNSVAQQQSTSEAGEQVGNATGGVHSSPSLADTLDFINRVLGDDSAGVMKNNGGCSVSLIREHMEKLTIPVGQTKVPGNGGIGTPDHFELRWAIIEPAASLRSDFNLKDIDPESIKVNEVFSIKIIADRDKTDPHLPPPDRSIVMFDASNLVKSIHQTDFVDKGTINNTHENGIGEIGFLLEPGTKNRLAKDATGDLLLMESNGRALRFAKAFKHAVELCGGKASAF
jgi:hypothetical protein